jgi:hypothetical protein
MIEVWELKEDSFICKLIIVILVKLKTNDKYIIRDLEKFSVHLLLFLGIIVKMLVSRFQL